MKNEVIQSSTPKNGATIDVSFDIRNLSELRIAGDAKPAIRGLPTFNVQILAQMQKKQE
ncbi:MAG: hypothetical protein WCI30_06605 [Clostridia bacterium]